jgi:hypothetical protein
LDKTATDFFKNNPSGLIFDYNCWYTTTSAPNNGFKLSWDGKKKYTYSNYAGYQSYTGFDAHSIFNSAPEFIDESNLDFHIKSTSPCIDAGVPSSTVVDYDGNNRPSGDACDMGAFEYNFSNPYSELTTPNMYEMSLRNYPNPFDSFSTFEYNLSNASKITLELFDISGRHISELVQNEDESGVHTCHLNGTNLSSGIYFAKITVNEKGGESFTKTIKIVKEK